MVSYRDSFGASLTVNYDLEEKIEREKNNIYLFLNIIIKTDYSYFQNKLFSFEILTKVYHQDIKEFTYSFPASSIPSRIHLYSIFPVFFSKGGSTAKCIRCTR